MLNLSINQGIFLENIKNACVTPIFKGGDKNLVTTYRSIPHFVKSVHVISPYSVQMWENMDQNNSEYEHLSHNVSIAMFLKNPRVHHVQKSL